ncbi:MAG: cysteine--tRNA ligase [Thermonemataceae bacterium]
MDHPLVLYNTLSKQKEPFQPINAPYVGIYQCGPTVYSDPHIGNARPAVVFDVLRRYLTYLAYRVRYVRNITDVGHLTGDDDQGEDKISKKARLEQKEPMEIVQHYTVKYHELMRHLNVLPPDVEPTATGHIVEQIAITQKIIEADLAYVANGSVYFDVMAYRKKANYGELSGKNIDELEAGAGNDEARQRVLEGQEEKKHPADFALWKKAQPNHLMRWQAPWSEGFPGWHLECTVMSTKYLGETFDIHVGGMDLIFPHHECEIAQAKAAHDGKAPVKYWLHNNMVLRDGKKMSKSLQNGITLEELFEGKVTFAYSKKEKDGTLTETHSARVYTPMHLRMLLLLSHYRSVTDITGNALEDARKTYTKLLNGWYILQEMHYPAEALQPDEKINQQLLQNIAAIYNALNDDLNTALAITHLLALLKKVNTYYNHPEKLQAVSKANFEKMKVTYQTVFVDILGFLVEKPESFEHLLQSLLKHYKEAKQQKAYDKVDEIRADLKTIGVVVKDMKTGVSWAFDEI